MKQYVYNGEAILALTDELGARFGLHKGDVISSYPDGMLQYGCHYFTLTEHTLREHFGRVYTEKEQKRYDRIHEQAMIAAMQSLIAKLSDKPVSPDMHEVEVIPKNAIWLADRLVEELKEREFLTRKETKRI